jgi:hypothetical protein
MSKLFVDEIVHQSSQGSGTITLGASGETISFASGVTGLNYPAFEARLSSDQTLTDNTLTKIAFATENLDTDNCYDNSTNYRFTPTVAGKYFVYLNVGFVGGGGINDSSSQIYRNTDPHIIALNNDSALTQQSQFCSGIINLNGTTDYVEAYANNDVAVGSSCYLDSDNNKTVFGAYRIGT